MPCNRPLSIWSHNISSRFNRSEVCDQFNNVSSITQYPTSQFAQLKLCVISLLVLLVKPQVLQCETFHVWFPVLVTVIP